MQIQHDIINWVEDKPKFWQSAIEKLIRNNSLTVKDILELKEICKAEIGLSKLEIENVDFDNLREFANQANTTKNISLTKILNIQNINALSETNELEFSNEGLTVIYGDNGAGKSSYASILKHICNTRGQKPLINNNLFDSESLTKVKKAEVQYTFDGQNLFSVELNNGEITNSTLKSVDVFDSYSANHYIEAEDEIAFIPQGLSIIEKLAFYLKQIENDLNVEIQTLELSKLNISLLQIQENTKAKEFIDSFNGNTSLDELRSNSIFNKTKEERIEQINEFILELKKTDPVVKQKTNSEKINRFNILFNKLKSFNDLLLGESSIKSIIDVLNEYVSDSETLKATSDKIFSNLPLKDIGNDTWKNLWESARKFYDEVNNNEYIFPNINEDANCPLCLQKLDDESKKRFVNFEDFVKQDIQKKYDESLKKLNDNIEKLNSFNFNLEEQLPTINEINETNEQFIETVNIYIEALTNQRNSLVIHLKNKFKIESISIPEVINHPIELIERIIKNLEAENKVFEKMTIIESLKPLESELNELKGEKILFDFKPKIAREIYRQKKQSLLNQCYSKCNTRNVTTFSNQLTSKYITQNIQDNFKEELKKLGFRNIKIETETKGVKGKQYHYLRLNEPNSNSVLLKDILSEGEHRCIALATFLSELSISEHQSSIIFDDPVSSLDHKWRNRIAKRIAIESKIRQVIVFTHDITFLLMLQEHCAKLELDITIKSLTRKQNETGIIANNPPWDALPINKRIGILKSDYQIIEKIERTETEEIYKERIKPLYGKLRESWERFVEEVFLNGAIQRFGREIQTMRLSKIIDLTENDFKTVEVNMSKCSTYFWGHDSAGTLIEEMPNSSEFLEDIKILEDFTSLIRRRRNK